MFLRSVLSTMSVTGFLVASAFAQVSGPWPVPDPWPLPPTGCHQKGVSVHTFYGAEADMTRYLNDMPSHGLSSRVRVVILEGNAGTTVRVFERAANGYSVSEWTGKQIGSLRSDWDERILKSRGNSCAGADLRADLENRGMRLNPAGTLEEATNETTLAPLVRGQPGYMRLSVYDPCE